MTQLDREVIAAVLEGLVNISTGNVMTDPNKLKTALREWLETTKTNSVDTVQRPSSSLANILEQITHGV